MQTAHTTLRKNSDIEALRTLAIILVIFAHISALLSPDSVYRVVLAYFRFGYGVDVFFCISGFIITKSIINEIPSSRSLKSILDFSIPFWTRRFWRLMPSAFFWVLMGLLLSAWHGGEGYIPKLKDFAWPAFAAAFQFFNVIFPACRDASTCGTVGIYWSLSLENQFYLILPVIAVLAGMRRMAMIFGAVFLAQFFYQGNCPTQPPICGHLELMPLPSASSWPSGRNMLHINAQGQTSYETAHFALSCYC